MHRTEVRELHYITSIRNVDSIFKYGILSHDRAARLMPASVASPGVQERRARIALPNGRRLHDCVNLYFNARNPMMYSIRERHLVLCVLRVDPGVIDIPGTIVTDGNAADSFTRFDSPALGLARLDYAELHAQYWSGSPDPFVNEERKRRRCAEVLVPVPVAAEYIRGMYVSCDSVRTNLSLTGISCPIRVSEQMFFCAPGVVAPESPW
jgi:hypothetical protein